MEFVDFSSPKARAEYESFVNNHPQGQLHPIVMLV